MSGVIPLFPRMCPHVEDREIWQRNGARYFGTHRVYWVKQPCVSLRSYLPELKASHPHHSTNRPITALTGEPRGSGSFPMSYRPSRGPSIIADANAGDRNQPFII
jgi:hypothetical protein